MDSQKGNYEAKNTSTFTALDIFCQIDFQKCYINLYFIKSLSVKHGTLFPAVNVLC